ncbi:MAG: peptide-methionine (S)-S-oxide reductase, partial [Edaphobacter sp.]
MKSFVIAVVVLAVLFLGWKVMHMSNVEAQRKEPIPAAKVDDARATTPGHEKAVFAGGCFWGTQAVFERVKGVEKTTAGYAGGSA